MSRGNGRMQIFLDDVDYRQFLFLLGGIVEEFEVECRDYCAIWNHYHVTLCPRKANFSEAMRCLNSQYAQWWNRRHNRVGHVFQGRFKDQIVEDGDYLRTLSRYIALNPVRAHLVARPEDWPWSSCAGLIGLTRPPSFLSVESTLRLFGSDDAATLRARYADHVKGTGDPAIMDRIRSNERVLGDKDFKRHVKALSTSIRESIGDPSSEADGAATLDRSVLTCEAKLDGRGVVAL
jgi:putative transposase